MSPFHIFLFLLLGLVETQFGPFNRPNATGDVEEESTLQHPLRILVFSPKFGHSHMKFMSRVADTLIDAGHHVSILAPDGLPEFKDSYNDRADVVHVDYGVQIDLSVLNKMVWDDLGAMDYVRLISTFGANFTEYCKQGYIRTDVVDWVKEQNFDIVLSEFFMCFDSLIQHSGIKKSITIHSTNPIEYLTDILGIPNAHSYVPGNAAAFGNKMSYWERLQNFLTIIFQKLAIRYLIVSKGDSYGTKYLGRDYIPIEEAASRHSFILVNNDELLDFPRPLSAQWIYVGGLRRARPSILPEEWNEILDGSRRVIVMSLGTNVLSKDMPLHAKKAFIEAFSSFPEITFIWKYEEPADEMFKNVTNVFAKKWIPQVDLLNDDRVFAFISHAGMGSVFESAFAGKPMVTLPFMADQLRNAEMMKMRGVSVSLRKGSILKDSIANAIREIQKPHFTIKAKNLAKMLKAKPFSPDEKLVAAVEFAARFDVQSHLSSPAAKMSIFELLMLDVILPLLCFPLLLFVPIFWTLRSKNKSV